MKPAGDSAGFFVCSRITLTLVVRDGPAGLLTMRADPLTGPAAPAIGKILALGQCSAYPSATD